MGKRASERVKRLVNDEWLTGQVQDSLADLRHGLTGRGAGEVDWQVGQAKDLH